MVEDSGTGEDEGIEMNTADQFFSATEFDDVVQERREKLRSERAARDKAGKCAVCEEPFKWCDCRVRVSVLIARCREVAQGLLGIKGGTLLDAEGEYVRSSLRQ